MFDNLQLCRSSIKKNDSMILKKENLVKEELDCKIGKIHEDIHKLDIWKTLKRLWKALELIAYKCTVYYMVKYWVQTSKYNTQ